MSEDTTTYAISGFITREEAEEYERIAKIVRQEIELHKAYKVIEDPIVSLRFVFEYNRNQGFSTYIMNECFLRNIQLDYDFKRGLFKESGRCTITGKKSCLDSLIEDMKLNFEKVNDME